MDRARDPRLQVLDLGLGRSGEGVAALDVRGAVHRGLYIEGAAGVLEPDDVVRPGRQGWIDGLCARGAGAGGGSVDLDEVVPAVTQVGVYLALEPAHVDVGGTEAAGGPLEDPVGPVAEHEVVGHPVLAVHVVVGVGLGGIGIGVGREVCLAGTTGTRTGIVEEHPDGWLVGGEVPRSLDRGREGEPLPTCQARELDASAQVGGRAGCRTRGYQREGGGLRDLEVLVSAPSVVLGSRDIACGEHAPVGCRAHDHLGGVEVIVHAPRATGGNPGYVHDRI